MLICRIFKFAIALDALKLRNVIQLVGLLAFHASLIVFAALQVHEARTALVTLSGSNCPQYIGCDTPGSLWRKVEPFLIVVPCIISAAWLVLIFLVRELYSEFGWAVFHVIGANPRTKTMYQWYQIVICLLKFDFFCFTALTMQLLIIVLPRDSAEFGLTIAAIPIVLLLLVLCGIAVKQEIKWIMSISLVLMLAAEAYFIYKLIRYYQPGSRDEYISTRATLTVITIAAFVLLFATFAAGMRCFADFDKGLIAAKTHDLSGYRSYFSSYITDTKTPYGGQNTETPLTIE